MPPSSTAAAKVMTDKPVPYMRQLCRHFGHRVQAEFDELSGFIQFDGGRVELDASAPDALSMTLTAADDQQLQRLEQVVGSHLERFGGRDELSVSWDA